ncbi:hypothetical protein EON68_04525, partial [archaeon]
MGCSIEVNTNPSLTYQNAWHEGFADAMAVKLLDLCFADVFPDSVTGASPFGVFPPGKRPAESGWQYLMNVYTAPIKHAGQLGNVAASTAAAAAKRREEAKTGLPPTAPAAGGSGGGGGTARSGARAAPSTTSSSRSTASALRAHTSSAGAAGGVSSSAASSGSLSDGSGDETGALSSGGTHGVSSGRAPQLRTGGG